MENSQAINQAGNPAEGAGGNEKTFTQEDVNRIVQERLARERGKPLSEAEKVLEEREKAVEAREREIAYKALMKEKNIPDEVYEALNCTSEDTFNKALEILGPYFQKLQEPIMNAVGPSSGATGGDSIRAAMGLK